VQTTSEYVTIAEAAERLGISKSAVRRRLHSGQLTGRQEERPQGHVWLIALPMDAPDAHPNGAAHHPLNGAAPTDTYRNVPEGADTSRQAPREVPAGAAGGGSASGTALQRAQEMAIYSEQLLAPYVRRIEEQAERIGHLEERAMHLQAELEQTRTQLAEATAPPPEPEPPRPPAPERGARRWWQRLLWG
jgi:predicted transcriptional regulator of viral defense system